METTAIVLVGAALVAALIAMEAGLLRLPRLRGREQRWRANALAIENAPAEDTLNAQCVATTADGERCVRAETDRRTHYCWQHQRMAQAVARRNARSPSIGLVPRLTRR